MDDDTKQAIKAGELLRLELPVEMAEAPVEDPDTGDVTFVCVAVDRNRKPNRRGLAFDWDDPKDVIVKNFLKNPVMPYAHKRDEQALPIGRWEKIEITKQRVRMWGRIPGGADYEDIKPIRVRVRDAYIKAVSIGLYIRVSEEVEEKNAFYLRVKSFEIVECSPCVIGAHESAIIGQDSPDPNAATRFALPARASWDEHELCDTKEGGRIGRLLTLSLPGAKGVPAVQDIPTVTPAAPAPEPVVITEAELITAAMQKAPTTMDVPAQGEGLPHWMISLDIVSSPLPPATQLYGMIAEFLGCKVRNIMRVSNHIPATEMGGYCEALRMETDKDELLAVRNVTSGGAEAPPRYQAIRVNSTRSVQCLLAGFEFFNSEEGKYALHYGLTWSGLPITAYTELGGRPVMDLFGEASRRLNENHPLKGESFSLAGDFLAKGAEDWNDLFLDPRNLRALQSAEKVIKKRGAQARNRGLMLMGPPGTGKTLSGRVLKNRVDCTFIWLSSRDFHYAGAVGGLCYAFSLARRVAPTVLFIEDVDNWLRDTTVDLIKTEMDGLDRSAGVVTILTTNFPERMPEALIDRPGRFHDVLKFDLPSAEIRTAMLGRWYPDASAQAQADAVEATDGYSGAHMRELCDYACSLMEDDELGPDTALGRAIQKIKEQRELISRVQLSGSELEPPDQLVLRAPLPDATVELTQLSAHRSPDSPDSTPPAPAPPKRAATPDAAQSQEELVKRAALNAATLREAIGQALAVHPEFRKFKDEAAVAYAQEVAARNLAHRKERCRV